MCVCWITKMNRSVIVRVSMPLANTHTILRLYFAPSGNKTRIDVYRARCFRYIPFHGHKMWRDTVNLALNSINDKHDKCNVFEGVPSRDGTVLSAIWKCNFVKWAVLRRFAIWIAPNTIDRCWRVRIGSFNELNHWVKPTYRSPLWLTPDT